MCITQADGSAEPDWTLDDRLSACTACGAALLDPDAHMQWHKDMEQAIVRAAVGIG